MAFNQPIEADRPESLGLLTAFSRAPVIGTLMWILGGDMAIKLDEEERMETEETLFSSTSGEDESILTPDRILSDVSECSGAIITIDEDIEEKKNVATTSETVSHSSNSIKTRDFSISRDQEITKRMSWSDESGQSLVEYFNESSCREPSFSSQPIKSAMKRSKSSYSNAVHKSVTNSNTELIRQRYIPSGIDKKESGGIVVPRGGVKAVSGGYISPQWGWYISTTPPQEIYGNKKSTIVKKESLIDEKGNGKELEKANSSIPEENTNIKAKVAETPLPIFRHTALTSSHGWPSVPL